jgi:hypothetical protein
MVMRIEFQQSGGVAGVARPPRTIDTKLLPAEEARRWQDLVTTADFFNLPPVALPGLRRDSFTYRITVEAAGRSHTVRTHVGAESPALDALIEQLREAQPTTPNKSASG